MKPRTRLWLSQTGPLGAAALNQSVQVSDPMVVDDSPGGPQELAREIDRRLANSARIRLVQKGNPFGPKMVFVVEMPWDVQPIDSPASQWSVPITTLATSPGPELFDSQYFELRRRA